MHHTPQVHMRSLLNSVKRIYQSPLTHLLNVVIIAVLVTILGAIISVENGCKNWQIATPNYPQFTIYLKINASNNEIAFLENILNHSKSNLIKNYQFISKEDGLKQLQQDQQIKQLTDDSFVLESTAARLPDIIVVNTNTLDAHWLAQLNAKISHLPMVDAVQLDDTYANKINDLLAFVYTIINFAASIVTIIIFLVLYNIIRLQMLLRQEEIFVARLIGASNNFIMRPLAYYAGLQVIIASVLAFLTVNWLIAALNKMVGNFSSVFGHNFTLVHITPLQFAMALFILLIFTVFTVFIAVHTVLNHKSKRTTQLT